MLKIICDIEAGFGKRDTGVLVIVSFASRCTLHARLAKIAYSSRSRSFEEDEVMQSLWLLLLYLVMNYSKTISKSVWF